MSNDVEAIMATIVSSTLSSFIKCGPIIWVKGTHGLGIGGRDLSMMEVATGPDGTIVGVDLSGFLCRVANRTLSAEKRDAVLHRLVHELLVSILEVTGKRYEFVGKFNDEADWGQILAVMKHLQSRIFRNLYGGRA